MNHNDGNDSRLVDRNTKQNTRAQPPEPILTISDLHMSLAVNAGAPAEILRGVNLTLGHGEIHGLVGESGAGKSMVGKAILGILPSRARALDGRIQFEVTDLLASTNRRHHRALLGRQITSIAQDPMLALNPVISIEQQMLRALRRHQPGRTTTLRPIIIEWLARVALRDPASVIKRYPHELSGGMRQRVLIAMAFCTSPSLVIADEPTTALDVTVQKRILSLLRDLQRDTGTAVLFISHDLGVIAKLCDSVSVMHTGRVVEHGNIADIITRPGHEYTRALLRATPRFDQPQRQLTAVPSELNEQLRNENPLHKRPHLT